MNASNNRLGSFGYLCGSAQRLRRADFVEVWRCGDVGSPMPFPWPQADIGSGIGMSFASFRRFRSPIMLMPSRCKED